MLTNPTGAKMIYETREFPVPPADWYMFATASQAQQVLAEAQKAFPNAQFSLVDGSMDGEAIFFIPPANNPFGITVWLLKGSVPSSGGNLVVDEYCGDLWDRGPKDKGFGGQPGEVDNNGAYAPIGGENLVFFDPTPGAGLAEAKWSNVAQGTIS